MKSEKPISDQGANSMLPVIAVGKSRAKWLASPARPDPRVRCWVITMSFDERGELISYCEGSLDEGGNEVSGVGIECCEAWDEKAGMH
jgi:hypothetical protein